MARLGSASLTGRSVASIRGGSSPLGVVRVSGSERADSGSSLNSQDFSTSRGQGLKDFLRQSVSISRADQIGFQAKSDSKLGFNSVKFLGELPNKITKQAGSAITPAENPTPVQSQRILRPSRPQVIWFGPPLQNIFPERGEIGQPQVVEKSISFSKPESEPALANPVEGGVNAIKIPREVPQFKVENGAAVEPVVKEIVQARRQLSIEQVNLMMMVRKARAMIARPKSQVIHMAGVEAEAVSASAVLSETQAAPTGQSSEIRTTSSEIKAVPENKTRRIVRKTKNAAKERDRLSPDRFRTRFVERDLEMNAWRLKALIKGFDELQQENRGGDVDGAALAAKSQIGSSRELRSVFLDQRGYRDRQDGSQKRMELFLSSVNMISKEQLKVIVKTHTAVKETYDKPREMATVKEVNDVVNEPKSLDTRFEPVQITEVVEEGRVEKTEVYNTKPLEYSPVATDEKGVSEELNEEREPMPEFNARVLTRQFELMGQKLVEVLSADRSLLQRRELVLK